MEKKKTIFDYMAEALIIFGVTTVILNIFALLFGESAKEVSTLFSLGSSGISVATSFQFLLVAAVVEMLRFVFFTDSIIKNMSIAVRTGLMFGVTIVITLIFNVIFGWFPLDMWRAWAGFFISFLVCSGVSTVVVLVKDKLENNKMQNALDRLKQER